MCLWTDERIPPTSGGNSWTALHYAATGRSVETCRTLLDHRANVEARSMDGCTPFYYAYRAGGKWTEMMVTFVTFGDKWNKSTWHTCEKGSHQKNKNRMQEKVCCVFRWCFTLETAKSRRMEWTPIDWRCFQIIMLRSRSRVGNLWKFGGLKIQDVWSDWLLNI